MKKVACVTVLGLGVLGCSSESADPAGTGGAGGAAGAGNLPSPVIPQSNGACPDFSSGTQEIMGLNR